MSVQELLDDRKIIPKEEYDTQVLKAIKLALSSESDALALVKEPNRIIQSAVKIMPEQVRLLIAHYQNHDEFIQQLLRAAGEDAFVDIELPLDRRTQIMRQYNPNVYQESGGVAFFYKAGNKKYPLIDRYTRDFTKPLISAGAGLREDILLDVESDVLHSHYNTFLGLLQTKDSIDTVLDKLSDYTKKVFPRQSGSAIDKKNTMVPLSEFILSGCGVCRHHALFNAYLLNRLSQEKQLPPSLKEALSGIEIIHHRQKINQTASHAWNIVKAPNGDAFNVDTLWRNGVFKLDLADLNKQDVFYQAKGIAKLMQKNYQCFVPYGDGRQSSEEKTCEQQLLQDICQGIEGGEIAWQEGYAARYTLLRSASGEKKLKPESIKIVYELAHAGSMNAETAETAYKKIVEHVSGDDAIQYQRRQALEDYIKERLRAVREESMAYQFNRSQYQFS